MRFAMYTNLDGGHELQRLRPLRRFRLDIIVISSPVRVASLLPYRRRPRGAIHRIHVGVVGGESLGVEASKIAKPKLFGVERQDRLHVCTVCTVYTGPDRSVLVGTTFDSGLQICGIEQQICLFRPVKYSSQCSVVNHALGDHSWKRHHFNIMVTPM